ncbi:MAG: PepSY domain-containing protein [Desulfuromusa sp.]|nr:PepSY domain-containing protein [Desulfuromusa sp.]
MKKTMMFVALVLMLVLGANQAMAGERPPADAVPLSEVVKSLEDKGYSPVTEVSMDNGVWEVEAYKDGQERELKVNPKDGQVLSDRLED